MTTFYRFFAEKTVSFFALMLLSIGSFAQLSEPDGLRMPGEWNDYTNTNPLAGVFNLTPTNLGGNYTTTFQSDFTGNRQFKFASGGSGSPWQNEWRNGTFTLNSFSNVGVNYLGTPNNNNQVNGLTNGRFYTVNFENKSGIYGTQFTRAIFMETTNAPVNITNVTQSPASPVLPSTPVAVTVTTSAAPSSQEIVYVRYSSDNFTTSTAVAVTMNQAGGTQGTVNLPGQADGSIVSYYVFTSTVASITSDFDMYTIRFNTNSGSNYQYSVASAPPVNVVFRVNMSNTTVNPGGVKLAGNFNGFSTSANPMTNVGSGIWEATVPLNSGSSIQYKFVNGSSYEGNLGAPCGNGSDRTYTVSGAATLPTVCFGQCADCVPPVNVTFRVNMSNQTVTSGISVSGNFNGWSTTANPLTNIGGGVWQATIPIEPGANIEYKFVNGSSYEGNLGAPCGNGSNRTYSVSTAATLPLVCFGECSDCVVPVNVKFRVNMATQIVTSGVSVSGSFNGFNTTANPMINVSGSIWETTIPISPGNYEYKFVNSGNYEGNQSAPCGNGSNRVLAVSSATTLPLVCFNSCNNCPSVVQLTLQVDMSNQAVSPSGVHVAGSFNGFNTTANPMTLIGGGVYSATIIVSSNATYTYKFLNGNSFAGVEGVSSVCGTSDGFGGFNRSISVGTSNKVVSPVCFGQCLGCTAPISWLGNSNNFSDGNNWSSGWAPTAGCRTVIINNSVNNPTISSGTFSIGNLTLNGGSGISVASGANLNICGNVNGSTGGWFTGNGNLTFNGASAQTISGNVTTEGTGTVTIDNAAGVSLATGARLEVRNGLKLQNGVLNVSAGNLIIGANASNQGRLLKAESGASLNGNITYEKYLTGLSSTLNGAWYYVAPTTVGFTLGEYDQGGNNMHPATFLPTNPDPGSLYTYSPNGGGFSELGWVKESSATNTIPAGKGIRIWARKVTSNNQFAYSGNPIGGTINFPLSFCNSGCSYSAGGSTNGWNLLANPYPCTIDWNATTGWTKNGISSNTVYIWNADQENYATYNGVIGNNGGSRYIAGGQAFFVNASSAASSLIMNEDVKVDTYTSGLRVASEEISGLRISAVSGNRRDEVYLDITPGHEERSAIKLDNPGLTLSLGQQNRFSIASPQDVAEAGIIPLNLRRNGSLFSFELEKSGPQWAQTQIYLKDDVNGQLFPVNEGISHFNFTATGSESNRFSLIISDAVTSVGGKMNSGISLYPNPSSGNIQLRNVSGLKGGFSITDLSGKVITSGQLIGVQQTLSLLEVPAGQYLIRFEQSPEVIRFSKL